MELLGCPVSPVLGHVTVRSRGDGQVSGWGYCVRGLEFENCWVRGRDGEEIGDRGLVYKVSQHPTRTGSWSKHCLFHWWIRPEACYSELDVVS